MGSKMHRYLYLLDLLMVGRIAIAIVARVEPLMDMLGYQPHCLNAAQVGPVGMYRSASDAKGRVDH